MSGLQKPLLDNKKNVQNPVVTSRQLDPEEAETRNMEHLETSVNHNNKTADNDDEKQLLLEERVYSNLFPNPTADSSSSDGVRQPQKSSLKKTSFKHVARRIMLMQKLHDQKSTTHLHNNNNNTSTGSNNSLSSFSSPLQRRHHRKHKSTAADLLDQIMETTPQKQQQQQKESNNVPQSAGNDLLERSNDDDTTLFHAAGIAVMESSSDEDSSQDDQEERAVENENDDNLFRGDILPMVMDSTSQYGSLGNDNNNNNNIIQSIMPVAPQRRSTLPVWKRILYRCSAYLCDPFYLIQRLYVVLRTSYLMRVALPLFVVAWTLYYGAGNPTWEFIPGSAHSSWWINFLGRQVVTFELARLTQWVVLDCFLLGSRTSALWMGPFVTMIAVQGRGGPFVMAAWACWDLLILRGDAAFQLHWLHFTGWKFYTIANSGRYILTSEVYYRILLASVVAGVVTTAKRMFLTVRFGRRRLVEFKPRLQKLLADMVLVSELADLAVEAGNLKEEEQEKKISSSKTLVASTTARPKMQKGLWTSVKFDKKNESMDGSGGETDEEEEEDEEEEQIDETSGGPSDAGGPLGVNPNRMDKQGDRPCLRRSSSGSIIFKRRLEKWDEPQTKVDKSGETSIQDVLKFKHALSSLDDTIPFGESFGKATGRDEAIDCAHRIYHMLLNCSPGAKVLPFEVLAWISFDEKDVQDEAKLKALRRLFHPDARNNLTLFAFVQSCDMVYKRLRYFKASVGNASVIDNELEKIANIFYWFLLMMLILAIMQINPWPLLVSMTSLLVSVSFALGSSVSKYVEGIMLIAVRRPFDLGDRILINSTESPDTPGAPMGWFVEDISLASTTLRFSKTNEVATVSNFAMSQSKIVNCQRSPSALVFLQIKLHSKILEGQKLKQLRESLQDYVRDHPRIWDNMLYLRHDHFGAISVESALSWKPNSRLDADNQFIIFSLCFQNRISWQSAARVNMNRADLLRHIYGICMDLGVQYDNMSPRPILVQNGNIHNEDPAATIGGPQCSPISQRVFAQKPGVDPSRLY